MDSTNEFLSIARKAAEKAGDILVRHLALPKKIQYKGIIDLVTDVDRQSEAAIFSVLKTAFPSHDILSEESAFNSTHSPYLWIVDPLDGTTNYAHGYPCFCISIALRINGRMALGTVYNPLTNDFYTAVAGKGAFKNTRPLHVSTIQEVNKALLCTGFPYDIGSSERNNLREFTRIIRHAQGVRRDGSAALDLCRVAEGSFDGFWELKLKPWDVAAGGLIALEAGGQVTSFSGEPFDPFTDTILCTNGLIHRDLLNFLHHEED